MMQRLTIFYALASLVLFFYSFTQVDLNLTISSVGLLQTFQKSFQYIGYYQRLLSTLLYLGILAAFFMLYSVTLKEIKKGKLGERGLWKIIWIISALLVLSYPAFSADMFNYMFTAKTILVYHRNPYEVIPLQFAGVEPWIMFMRWIHLPSAYTPLWILMTLPAYLLGFGYFLLVMWNIKFLVAAFYLWSIWLIGKILGRVDNENKVYGMAIFALNPLIIIESLVSGHNDVTMMALALLAFYLYLRKNVWGSFLALATSVGLKLITFTLIPVFFLKWNRTWAIIAMIFGFLAVVFEREVLPWYWVWIVPFVSLLPRKNWITTISTGISLGMLLRYLPFISLGNYDPPVPTIRVIFMWIPILVALFVAYRNNKFLAS